MLIHLKQSMSTSRQSCPGDGANIFLLQTIVLSLYLAFNSSSLLEDSAAPAHAYLLPQLE